MAFLLDARGLRIDSSKVTVRFATLRGNTASDPSPQLETTGGLVFTFQEDQKKEKKKEKIEDYYLIRAHPSIIGESNTFAKKKQGER